MNSGLSMFSWLQTVITAGAISAGGTALSPGAGTGATANKLNRLGGQSRAAQIASRQRVNHAAAAMVISSEARNTSETMNGCWKMLHPLCDNCYEHTS